MITLIDLSRLPPPAVVEQLSYESIRDAMLSDLAVRDAALADLLPSDPAYKIIEVCAYREMLVRSRCNSAATAQMLAFASGADLDHVGVTYMLTERLVLDPGNPAAVPPELPVYEADDDYRARLLLAFDAYSTAGAEPSYRFHAMSASALVKHVGIHSPAPVEVVVTVLSHSGTGAADAALLAAVEAALSDDVRPFTDQVTVQSAAIVQYSVVAALNVYSGVESETVRQMAQAALSAWVSEQHRVGRSIRAAGLIGALMVEGVHDAALAAPGLTADLIVEPGEAPYCTGTTVTVGGITVA